MPKRNIYFTPNFNTMKLFFLLIVTFPFYSIGQDAIIHFDIKNATSEKIEFSLWDDYLNQNVLFGETYIYVPIKNGKTDWNYPLSNPTRVTFFYNSEQLESEYSYSFFLSPGDELYFSIDEQNIAAAPIISGRGSENNQPLIQSLHESFINELIATNRNDTLPNNVFQLITNKSKHNQFVLNAYINQFHPSNEFIENERVYNQHFTLINYEYFNEYYKYKIIEQYTRNLDKWKSISDSLFELNPLNEDKYLNTPGYAAFLSNWVEKMKVNVWSSPKLQQIYFTSEKEMQEFLLDPENLLKEKIINRHFTGKTAEFLYADLFTIHNNIKEDNLPEIFDRFKLRYPNSSYIPYIEPKVNSMLAKRKNELSANTIIISNVDSIQSFNEVLELVKGKTVLLDMWGMWCTACRRELANHAEDIKEYYKNKPLDYLYIANNDESNEEKWRELIPYYKLTGTHILANQQLSKDIMSKVNSSGYPTYIIIKKDGTFELYDRSKGLELDTLFKQIDQILNEE